MSRLLVGLFFMCLFAMPCRSVAQDMASDTVQQYYVTGWNSDNGLTSNAVLSVQQTPDGFLWVGTYDGLLRFDGTKFNRLDTKYNSIFRTSGVLNLSLDRRQNLWIGTNGGGLVTYDRNSFKQLESPLLNGESVNKTYEDSKGNIWVGTRLNLFVYNRKTLVKVNFDTLKNLAVNDMIEDQNGMLWVATEKEGLLKIKNGSLVDVIDTRKGLISNAVTCLSYDAAAQKLWVGTADGLACIDANEKVTSVPTLLLKHRYQPITSLLWDGKRAELWVGTDDGLYSIQNGKQHIIKSFTKEFIIDLHKDREDNLWVGTYREGLFKIRRSPFVCYQNSDGLVNNVVNAIYEDSQKNLWIGTDGGLSRFKNGEFTNYTEKDGLPTDRVRDVLELEDGSLLIGTYAGAAILKNGKISEPKFNKKLYNNKIRRIFKDMDGTLWLGTRSGLIHIDKNQALTTFTKKDNLADDYVMALTRSKARGLVISTNSGGLNFYKDDKFSALTVAQGMPSNIIFDAYEDDQQRLWVATNEGLALLMPDNTVKIFKSKDGLANDVIFNILPDGKGHFWMGCNRGIFRVKIDDLLAFADKKLVKLTCLVFRKTEGLISDEVTATGRACVVRDGLIFPTIKGFAQINPEKFRPNPTKPQIAIEYVLLNGQEYSVHDGRNQEITVEPGTRYLNIKFTALSFIAPEKVRFKYRLYPFEKEWIEVLNEREARYTNLPPGNYTFQVQAANNDGVWNEDYISLKIEKMPFFYETKLFYVLAVLLALIGGVSLYRLRMRAINLDKARLEHMVTERTRKAEELAQQVSEQANEISKSYQKMSDSINYARRLQNALVPSERTIATEFPESFFLYKPKDIISGDFAWFTQHPEATIVILGDCTGHGVPGAFMTIIAHNLLQKIIVEQEVISPALILKQLDFDLRSILHQNTDGETVNDGVDLSICAINPDKKSMSFAGAMTQIYLWREGQNLEQIKGDRFPIGSNFYNDKFFANKYINLQDHDMIYMTTDGFQDQFGGDMSRKYMVKRLRDFIQQTGGFTVVKQRELFEAEYQTWKKDFEQTDDVSVLAFRIEQ
ncbi:MAG: hypothetical protein EAZ57_02825 [Cytophagales bacterium]|nr:MAG: hypothetical protein EAZ67_03290 [Cytophagales bacterium]TAF61694.1 MAG: hypothetical protein EAZ57_02825 [Cytophagales bacterium]